MSNASINCRCDENFLTTMAVDKDFAVSGAKMGLGISEDVLIYLLRCWVKVYLQIKRKYSQVPVAKILNENTLEFFLM